MVNRKPPVGAHRKASQGVGARGGAGSSAAAGGGGAQIIRNKVEPRIRGQARAGSIVSAKGSGQNSPRDDSLKRTSSFKKVEDNGVVKDLKEECSRLKEENSELRDKVERLRGEGAQ